MTKSIPTNPLDEVKAHRAFIAARASLRNAAQALNAATSHNACPPGDLEERVAAVNAAHLNLIAATEAYAQAKA